MAWVLGSLAVLALLTLVLGGYLCASHVELMVERYQADRRVRL